MDVLNFIVTVILVTASGALAPGPLFFATISHGTKSGAKSGIAFSFAHMIIEFTLVMLFALGLIPIADYRAVKFTVGFAGGFVLIVFGVLQIQRHVKPKPNYTKNENATMKNLLIVGLTYTGLNPFFIIWWLTAGANLILQSLEFAALPGVIFMYLCHVWMDFVWLIAIAHFAQFGTEFLGFKLYRGIIIILGGVLIYFGFIFLVDSFRLILFS